MKKKWRNREKESKKYIFESNVTNLRIFSFKFFFGFVLTLYDQPQNPWNLLLCVHFSYTLMVLFITIESNKSCFSVIGHNFGHSVQFLVV